MKPVPVEILELTRRFGRRIALDSVELSVAKGEIVGLVGPNGSGKTTLLSIVAGLLRPHAGVVRVFGLDPYVDGPSMLERTRFAFAPPAFFPDLTPREQLRHLTRIRRGRTAAVSRAEIDAALATVGLADRANDRVRTFSLGMKQRLALAQALLPRPELIVLDEPTEGLDPLAVLDLRAVLSTLREEHGIGVLLSSHLMVEVEQLVDRILVLHEGRSLFYGQPSELVAGAERLCLVVENASVESTRAALSEHGLEACLGDSQGGGAELQLDARALDLDDAQALLRSRGVDLLEFRHRRPTLEEALLSRLRSAALESKR